MWTGNPYHRPPPVGSPAASYRGMPGRIQTRCAFAGPVGPGPDPRRRRMRVWTAGGVTAVLLFAVAAGAAARSEEPATVALKAREVTISLLGEGIELPEITVPVSVPNFAGGDPDYSITQPYVQLLPMKPPRGQAGSQGECAPCRAEREDGTAGIYGDFPADRIE